MTKSLLLLAAAALTATTAVAQDDFTKGGETLENYVIVKVSPNGKWAISNNPYSYVFSILNLETGDKYDYEEEYLEGSGNCVSNDGIALLSLSYDGTPFYWKGGEILTLPLKENDNSAYSCGITPDGSRIVGTIGMPMTIEDVAIMQRPAIWNRNAEGGYDMYIELPYPDKDWTGRMPQYILTNEISADGKTIIGQVHDYSGTSDQPIVWHEDAEGNWTYQLLHPELLNPNNVALPEWPGECPEGPKATDYMTEEQAQKYQDDCNNWDWQSGKDYPVATDYMTEEQKAAYEAAQAENEKAVAEWNDAFDKFMEAVQKAQEGAMKFSMNSTLISANGRYYATMHQDLGSWFMPVENPECYPVVFDLLTGEYKTFPVDGQLMAVTYINDNGMILGASPANQYARRIYIAENMDSQMVPFDEWIATKNPELYAWMEENLKHDYTEEYLNEETWEYEERLVEGAWITGTAAASSDLSTVTSWTQNVWDLTDEAIPFYSYILPVGDVSGVANVAIDAKQLTVKAAQGGDITLVGEATSLEVFDLQGRKVYENLTPAAVNATGLSNGVYTIRATAPNGQVVVKKAAL